MQLNVMREGEVDLYAHEDNSRYYLVVPPSSQELNKPATEFLGTIEVDEVLSINLAGEVEAVKLDGREYTSVWVNPIANKVVLEDANGYGPFLSF
jgi:hypothetical protein